jgi:hypothetical protein
MLYCTFLSNLELLMRNTFKRTGSIKSHMVKQRRCGVYNIALLEDEGGGPATQFYRLRGMGNSMETISVDEAKEIAAFINRVN